MKQIAYIIPGYGESHTRQKGYNAVAEMFKAKSITPIHIKIDWSKKPGRFSDYAQQFLKQYKKPKGAKIYVLGFSFGAIAALLSAGKAKPDVLMLCSLSPYFNEDRKHFNPSWLRWWRKNITESDYTFADIAPTVHSKTYLIVGSDEDIGHEKDGSVLRRVRDAKRKIAGSSLTIAKGAKHRISQKEYLVAAAKVIAKF